MEQPQEITKNLQEIPGLLERMENLMGLEDTTTESDPDVDSDAEEEHQDLINIVQKQTGKDVKTVIKALKSNSWEVVEAIAVINPLFKNPRLNKT